ncbi:MAG: hypothetical protein Rubg2KO_35790 [Rubricoccaceae bacterium]
MTRDIVDRIELDAQGRLHVVPRTETFPFIWREAMEVHWNFERGSLYSPSPQTWSYGRWLVHILSAARGQGSHLEVTAETEWVHMEPALQAQMLACLASSTGTSTSSQEARK